MSFEKTHLIIAMAALLTASTAVAQQVELVQIATNDAPGGTVIGAVDPSAWLSQRCGNASGLERFGYE